MQGLKPYISANTCHNCKSITVCLKICSHRVQIIKEIKTDIMTPVDFVTFKSTFKFKIERGIHPGHFLIPWVTHLAWMPAINKQCR